MKQPNSETVIPSIQLLPDGDDSELQIRLGVLDLRIELTMRDFVQLMRGRVINPKAKFRPATGSVATFKLRHKTIMLDADTLAMPTLDENGYYLLAADRLQK
jgi:hypothetical protein